jgi:MFS family permease
MTAEPVQHTAIGVPVSAAQRRSFGRMWLATLVAGAGEGVRMGALPLLAASLTREPTAVAAVWVAGGLPFVLVGPFTGVLVDRLRHRTRLLWTSDAATALVMGGFAVAVAADATSIALMMAVNFVLGSVQTLRDNAALTVVPQLVEPRKLDAANSRIQGAQLVTIDLLGPPAGALLFALPAAVVFTADAVASGTAAILVAGIVVRAAARTTAPGAAPDAPRRPVRTEVAAGFRWLRAHRLMRTVCVLVGLSGMAVTCVVSIAVLYALEVLRVGGLLYAVLLGVVAIGAVAGALVAPVLTARIGRSRSLVVAFALAPPAFVVAGLTGNPYVAAVALTAVGASVGISNLVSVSLRQTSVPPELMGRVNASYRLVAVGAVPVGALLGGLLGSTAGLRAPFFAAALIFLVGLAVAWRSSITAGKSA